MIETLSILALVFLTIIGLFVAFAVGVRLAVWIMGKTDDM